METLRQTGTALGSVLQEVSERTPPAEQNGGFDAAGFATELEELRAEVMAARGSADAAYIRNLVRLQRRLELAGRAVLMVGAVPPLWLLGTSLLSLSKILENMEIGHNVMHGQWDWMRDPDIHSATWDWDNVCTARQWKHTHNHMHHQWTNVRGRDADIGYGVLRVDPDQAWNPTMLLQPLTFLGLALVFEYGVALHDAPTRSVDGPAESQPESERLAELGAKVRRQLGKDVLAWPLLSLPFGLSGVISSLSGALVANVVRNVWAAAVIFCGHFPDGVSLFDPEEVEGESKGEWYRRQVLGSVNFTGGRIMDVMSGNLDHQVEHHLFPDLPSNRYAGLEPRVREICARHGVAYNSRPFLVQLGSVVRKVVRLALP
jgi:linoleoyl-CoA desaturase